MSEINLWATINENSVRDSRRSEFLQDCVAWSDNTHTFPQQRLANTTNGAEMTDCTIIYTLHRLVHPLSSSGPPMLLLFRLKS